MNYYTQFIVFIQSHMLACPSRILLQVDCPGCGMQRSLVALMQGRLSESLSCHPAGILIAFVFPLLLAHLIFRFRKGALTIVGLQASIAIVSLTFYVYKLFTHQAFH